MWFHAVVLIFCMVERMFAFILSFCMVEEVFACILGFCMVRVLSPFYTE